MGTLVFEVDREFLHDALKLPADVEVVEVYGVFEPIRGVQTLQVCVSHADFPDGTHRVIPVVHKEPVKYTWDWSYLEPDRD